MNQLDLTDVLGTSFPWMNTYGADAQIQQQQQQQLHLIDNSDMGYLSSRSVMLEPIMEETSDDDDEDGGGGTGPSTWSTYDNGAWSSESETGSVIRVEINQGMQSIFFFFHICVDVIQKEQRFIIYSENWCLLLV